MLILDILHRKSFCPENHFARDPNRICSVKEDDRENFIDLWHYAGEQGLI